MENKVAKHMEICKGLNALYERKNHDYGDSFHATFMAVSYTHLTLPTKA